MVSLYSPERLFVPELSAISISIHLEASSAAIMHALFNSSLMTKALPISTIIPTISKNTGISIITRTRVEPPLFFNLEVNRTKTITAQPNISIRITSVRAKVYRPVSINRVAKIYMDTLTALSIEIYMDLAFLTA